MKTSTHLILAVAALFGGLAVSCAANASAVYNLTGWDTTGAGGLDGGFPANWVGGSAPAYTGSLNAMWYADVGNGASESVSSTDARSKGADPTYALAVGPRAWNDNTTGTTGQGHGSDFGLIHLNAQSNLSVTVAADSALASNLKPAFSLFAGWDTGATSVRVQTYQNNANNPLGTTGLIYLNSTATTTPGGSVTFLFTDLAAGNYSLFVGGNYSGGAGSPGKYTVSLTASPVPLPAAFWLFGSAVAGLGLAGRRKGKADA